MAFSALSIATLSASCANGAVVPNSIVPSDDVSSVTVIVYSKSIPSFATAAGIVSSKDCSFFTRSASENLIRIVPKASEILGG